MGFRRDLKISKFWHKFVGVPFAVFSGMNSQSASGEARTLAQVIEKRLSSDILFGRFVPDSRLRLGFLSNFYASGVSSLREALAQLVGKGLVIQDGQRGFRVAPVSQEDLLDVTRTRIGLETMALRLAINKGEAAWEASILAAHHRLSRRSRTEELLIDEVWEKLHHDFHFSLIAACGSLRLLSFCGELYDHFDRYRRIAVLQARRHPSLSSSHRDIVEGVLARKPDAAARLLQAHIEKSASEITIMLSSKSPAARNGRVTTERQGAATKSTSMQRDASYRAPPSSRRRQPTKAQRAKESHR
jgi:GntR family carbon starvation induced transcriptional regulator